MAISVALDGVDSLAVEGVGNGKITGVQMVIRKLKFTEQARKKV